MTFMVFGELFAEKAKWFCVEFTLNCISNMENGQLKDSEGNQGTQLAALCGWAYRELQFLIIWKTKS